VDLGLLLVDVGKHAAGPHAINALVALLLIVVGVLSSVPGKLSLQAPPLLGEPCRLVARPNLRPDTPGSKV